MENKTFTYKDSKNVEHTISFKEDSFKLNQINTQLSDTKLKTKPTTFFKDAMRRFVKNKSSVVGAAILGSILLLTIFVPIFDTNSLDTTDPNLSHQTKLAPKLFDTGSGFWDGTTEYTDIAMDFDWDAYKKDGTYSGTPVQTSNSSLKKEAIVGNITYSKVGEKKLDDNITSYARGGYMRVSSAAGSTGEFTLSSPEKTFNLSSAHYTLEVEMGEIEDGFKYGVEANYTVAFAYKATASDSFTNATLEKSSEEGAAKYTLDLNSVSSSNVIGKFVLTMTSKDKLASSVLVKSVVFSSSDASTSEQSELALVSAEDANLALYRAKKDDTKQYAYTSTADLNIYHADYVSGTFRYDTYLDAFGDYTNSNITFSNLTAYQSKGWMTFDYSIDDFKNSSMTSDDQTRFIAGAKLTEEGQKHCPLRISEDSPLTVKVVKAGKIKTASFTGTMSRYREYGYSSMPKFLFGTDAQGRDMFKLVFNGLRFSIILGVVTTLINIVIGLIWGSISGYFGGWVDIIMERFCDILGGIPWVVVMTLILINKPDNMSTILMVGIALCTTGWLGTASLTRTQFYRFKDREYILAARTLGAKDGRLIFRHILPNAIGTLITSSVLMIPSVIFSEASLSYLRIVNGMQGFGTTLSNNQAYMTTYPFLILFPSVVMALIMISFNLFGNGLRDAFNPSLKGGE